MTDADALDDRGEWLTPAARQGVLATIARWHDRGYAVRVVVLPRGESLEASHALWRAWRLDPARDLLLLFNGVRWEARGWGLDRNRIRSALATAEPVLREQVGRALAQALDRLGAAATAGKMPPEGRSRRGVWIASGAALVAAVIGGGVAAVIVRRRRRAAAGVGALDGIPPGTPVEE